jgi:hypothetical protein
MSELEKRYSPGLAAQTKRPIEDPGIEPHRVRMTDKSEKHARTAEKQIAAMFGVSVIGAIHCHLGLLCVPDCRWRPICNQKQLALDGPRYGPIDAWNRLRSRALGKNTDA